MATGPSLSESTASTATECARMAGWAFRVAVSSASGPSAMRRESGKPSTSSASAKTAVAVGWALARAEPMPTTWDP